ncbi:Zinc finger, DHHC-type, palmitoyltransferase domain-containing protein [Strongyloides ratti]|uniref:Palmitoyltransferase n=1 Tax=Strongyloides ratti TaxID=34506 RepID=A0A090LAQ2_STRRB|nr:Zinc finger, DHHC-type, palmitoyltransferase domain-containing protein [Strongyloides ratti]CEF66832.1 Zinc finger, DHHC-type, palmitoyltransferase domain-containing protein [Strongyloides ratti]
MSWYGAIYSYTRKVRKRKPFFGYILHLLCNMLLIMNLSLTFFTYHCILNITLDDFLFNLECGIVYLFITTFAFGMTIISLGRAIFEPPAKVPNLYMKGEQYSPDDSNPQQIEEQKTLLEEYATIRKLKFAEVDQCERLRYCYICKCFKPDRARHCSSCGFCVLKFDHHCPYINTCINFSNYKYFINYIFYGSIFWLFSVIGEVYGIVIYSLNYHSHIHSWDTITQLVFALSIQLMPGKRILLDLLTYHYSLIKINETTCEQCKPPIFRGGNINATYNTTVKENIRSALGWGLWLFPVDTEILDGLNFPVFYYPESQGPKMVVRLGKDPAINYVDF